MQGEPRCWRLRPRRPGPRHFGGALPHPVGRRQGMANPIIWPQPISQPIRKPLALRLGEPIRKPLCLGQRVRKHGQLWNVCCGVSLWSSRPPWSRQDPPTSAFHSPPSVLRLRAGAGFSELVAHVVRFRLPPASMEPFLPHIEAHSSPLLPPPPSPPREPPGWGGTWGGGNERPEENVPMIPSPSPSASGLASRSPRASGSPEASTSASASESASPPPVASDSPSGSPSPPISPSSSASPVASDGQEWV